MKLKAGMLKGWDVNGSDPGSALETQRAQTLQ